MLAPWWQRHRALLVLAVVLALVVAFVVNTAVTEARRQAEMTDQMFCTLAGVDPLDKAPGTGRRCITVLGED